MVRYLPLLALLGLTLICLACGSGKSKSEQAADTLQRGLEAQRQGRLDEAAAAYHNVLDLEPRNKFAFFNLGLIDQTSGRPRAAENNYRLALSIDPDFTPALFNLAIELYRQVIALNPEDAGPHLNLGLLLRSIGQETEADAEIQRAVQLDPGLGARLTDQPRQTTSPEPAGSPTP
jgi:tetratricopeptide (TPR) repeat protein